MVHSFQRHLLLQPGGVLNQTGSTSQITLKLAMEPDTLKKQTCYRESVYILFSPSSSLSLPLFSLHCLGWQFLDCFTSRSLCWWLLRGKTQTHNLFFLTAIHCVFVNGRLSGQYCLDSYIAEMWIQRWGHNRTRQDVNFYPTHKNPPSRQSFQLVASKPKLSRTPAMQSSDDLLRQAIPDAVVLSQRCWKVSEGHVIRLNCQIITSSYYSGLPCLFLAGLWLVTEGQKNHWEKL